MSVNQGRWGCKWAHHAKCDVQGILVHTLTHILQMHIPVSAWDAMTLGVEQWTRMNHLKLQTGSDEARFVCSNAKHQCKLTATTLEMITLEVLWSRSTQEVRRNWKAMMTEFRFLLWWDLCDAGVSFGCMLQMQIVLSGCRCKTQEVTGR